MSERKFSREHIWILQKGENAVLGLTDHAQEELGDIMFLNLPDVGDKVQCGQQFGDVESIKTVSELISPTDGTVVKINEALLDEPERINEDPYKNWLVEVEVHSVSDGLMDEEAYRKWKDAH